MSDCIFKQLFAYIVIVSWDNSSTWGFSNHNGICQLRPCATGKRYNVPDPFPIITVSIYCFLFWAFWSQHSHNLINGLTQIWTHVPGLTAVVSSRVWGHSPMNREHKQLLLPIFTRPQLFYSAQYLQTYLMYIIISATWGTGRDICYNGHSCDICYNGHAWNICYEGMWDSYCKAGLRLSTYTTKLANWPITDAPDDIVV